DILFNESQRQYLEAMGMQGIEKPNVAYITGVSPAISLKQQESSSNPRSTVGTKTAMYTSLRMIYEKLGIRSCPNCKENVNPIHSIEETEHIDGDFIVFQICPHCQYKFKKLTRSHFSYNTIEGACQKCKGLGEVIQINQDTLFNMELSIENGAIALLGDSGRYFEYHFENINRTMNYYHVPIGKNTPLKSLNELQFSLLCHSTSSEEVKQLTDKKEPKTLGGGKFKGIMTILWHRYQEKSGDMGKDSIYFYSDTCPDCQGTKLNKESRTVKVMDHTITDIAMLNLEYLLEWVNECRLKLTEEQIRAVDVYIRDIEKKLKRIKRLGLGYLTLERRTNTLSGGESQRIQLSAILDSDLTDVVYIIDEPTASLHAKDTEGIVDILKKLSDKGNTVLVIE